MVMKHMHLSVLALTSCVMRHGDSKFICWRSGRYWFQIKLAKLAEKSKLDVFFLGDGQYISGEETDNISYYFELLMALAAISRETHPVGLIDTIFSFYEPYLAACMLSRVLLQSWIYSIIITKRSLLYELFQI